MSTAYERGWSTFKNGDLLNAAERDGIDVMITTDSNLRHQQNLGARSIAVVCLRSTSWPRIRRISASIVNAVIAVEAIAKSGFLGATSDAKTGTDSRYAR